MRDAGIVRNRLKIAAAVQNARAFLAVQKEFGYVRSLHLAVRRRQAAAERMEVGPEVPASTAESDAMSKDLKKRGFTFVGTTICYAFMQAMGMVNDHFIDCFRYRQISTK